MIHNYDALDVSSDKQLLEHLTGPNNYKQWLRYAQDIPKICPRYAQDMPEICPRYALDMPEVCQRYAQDMTTRKTILTKCLPDKTSKAGLS